MLQLCILLCRALEVELRERVVFGPSTGLLGTGCFRRLYRHLSPVEESVDKACSWKNLFRCIDFRIRDQNKVASVALKLMRLSSLLGKVCFLGKCVCIDGQPVVEHQRILSEQFLLSNSQVGFSWERKIFTLASWFEWIAYTN